MLTKALFRHLYLSKDVKLLKVLCSLVQVCDSAACRHHQTHDLTCSAVSKNSKLLTSSSGKEISHLYPLRILHNHVVKKKKDDPVN